MDAQAPYEQSRDMAAALKGAGKTFRFITLADGDHQFSAEKDRTLLLREIDGFLTENIGAANP